MVITMRSSATAMAVTTAMAMTAAMATATSVASGQPAATPPAPVTAQAPPPGYAPPPPGYAAPPPGYGPPPPGYGPPPEAPSRDRLFGVGYKAGNGIGFVGGDIIVGILPHLNLDVQASYFRVSTNGETAHGYAFAPMLQVHLTSGGKNTIYVAGGMQYAHVELSGVSANVKGIVGNLGYIWKWPSGFGILLGGGIQHFWGVAESNGSTVIARDAGTFPNIEFGVRKMF
jgi:hypothetical protein